MTEKEAIEVLKNNYPKKCKMINGRYKGGFDDIECDFGQALTMAIAALKEVQQYRETGLTPELIQTMKGHNNDLIEQLAEYQEIATEAVKERDRVKRLSLIKGIPWV